MNFLRFKNIRFRRIALLRIVQLVTALPVNIFLFIALKNTNGFFGTRDTLALPGIVLAFCFMVAVIAAGIAIRKQKSWGFRIGGFTFAVIAACFLIGFNSDKLISLIGALFNGVLAFKMFRDIHKYSGKIGADINLKDKQFGAWSTILLWLNFVAVAVSFLEAGYRISISKLGIISGILIVFGTLLVSVVLEWRKNRPTFKKGPYIEWILLFFLIVLIFFKKSPMLIIGLAAVRQLIVISRLFWETEYADRFSKYFFKRPAQLLALSFIGVITIGTVILSFPYISVTGRSIPFINAFFTSTSATCVTGLIVLDTPHDFTFFGQSVILALIQIGGIGIMTISTFAAILIGRSVGLGQEYSLAKMIGENRVNRVYQLIKFICLFTFVIEAIGVAILFPQFRALGFSWKTGLWKSVFHSVSGFCNAGFSLQTDSLASFQNNPGILMTMSSLVIIGGLGFGVIYWFFEWLTGSYRKEAFHVKIVLWCTGILLFGTACFILISEFSGALSGLSLADKFSNAWFAAVTPRTAGFNTIAVSAFKPVTRFVTTVLMFIGVAPGSTGGGVKITTILVLILTVRTLIRGDSEVQGFGYSVSFGTVFRAAAVLTLGIATCVIGFSVLLATQNIPFETLGFETFSAFGTVGLSMGATTLLNSFGKIVIIVLMFIGRVGPLTLVLSMRPMRKQEIYYPKANVMVG